ncbi:MAG: hypothetical protein K0S71_334 [Clostridia bacterium]|jgi:hypothetical protein|nr:hypothetical protein [Clostridia bacterium]
MSLTLLEASKYSTDMLQAGVIETMAKENAVIEVLPFMTIEGNAYKYNVETALPNVEFRAVNSGYTAGAGAAEQKVEGLVILGGDVDVDKFIVQTRSNVNDIRAIQVQLKAKAVANTYADKFFNGDNSLEGQANEFDGLKVRLAGTAQEISVQDAGGKLLLDDLNALIDAVDGGAEFLFMGKATRRLVTKLLQSSQHYIEQGQDAFGRPVSGYGGAQIRVIDDSILPAGKIYAVKTGVLDAVCGLENGSLSVRDLGEIDSMPVLRTRIEWYCGMAVFNPKTAAVLNGIVAA